MAAQREPDDAEAAGPSSPSPSADPEHWGAAAAGFVVYAAVGVCGVILATLLPLHLGWPGRAAILAVVVLVLAGGILLAVRIRRRHLEQAGEAPNERDRDQDA